jgi:predicted RNA-binding protein with PIN domain
VADPTLYLFDGDNVLHAGEYRDSRELVDQLASFVALKGARGIVVFDGVGEERVHGPLEVRFAPHADTLLERLAAEHRTTERVCLVSSDMAIRGTSGQEVMKVSSKTFVRELDVSPEQERRPHRLGERLDKETRDRLEQLRRNRSD